MTLHVTVNPDTEARLRVQAQQAGKEIAVYISELLETESALRGTNGIHTSADFDAALDALFAGDTRQLPSIDLTYSRQDIYFDRD